MSSAVEEHVIYQIANAPLREYPYAHIYIENIFPPDFYAQLRAHWPGPSALTSLAESGRVPKGAYPERFVVPFTPAGIARMNPDHRDFWTQFADWLLAGRFITVMIDKFERHVKLRFGEDFHRRCSFEVDSLVVRDLTNYSIGPHTDLPHRLLSMLFYCPDDDRYSHLGTSLYVPRDPGFRCKGGPHYPHRHFDKVKTMAYKANSLFAFVKNNHSFHGVEPISDQNVQRDVLLYDIRVVEAAAAPARPPAAIGFNMLKRLLGRRQH
jgi:hypothetical protein